MKSKVHIKGHPLHPLLIAFPTAFLSGTLIFDILARWLNKPVFWETGGYLTVAGVFMGLVAAVPGLIDYFFTVPPKSSAKQRATRHALINVLTLVLFTCAWIYRQSTPIYSYTIICIEAAGLLMLIIGGWLGGGLVYMNQIAVDNKYAGLGRWNEISIQESKGKIWVAKTSELKLNQMKLVRLPDKRIVLGRSEDGFFAFDDRCTHKGGSLAGGTMMCNTVQCPWHGSQFDIQTGEAKCGPATRKINTYKVSVENGKVFIEI